MNEKYYRAKPHNVMGEIRLIVKVATNGMQTMRGSEYGPDVDWEPAPGVQLSNCIEISQAEAYSLLYDWQMHEYNNLPEIYRQPGQYYITPPQRTTQN